MYKKLPNFFLSLFFICAIYLAFISVVNAQTCVGSYECPEYITQCTMSDGSYCDPGEPGCACRQVTGPGTTYSCSQFNGNQAVCSDANNAIGICPGSRNATWGCSWSSGSSGGGGGNPPPPTVDACTSACGGAACEACGGGFCCGSDVCVGGGSCCPGSAPYLCSGGCYAEPCSSSPPPPSGGSCGTGTPTGDSNPDWACCPSGYPTYCGSGVCVSGSCGGGSAPAPAPTSAPVSTPPPSSGGGSTPPPASGGGCSGSGQIYCGGSCWSSTCTGTLSCSPSGTPVCTVPPPVCGAGQVACGGSCVGVGGSCPGGWQCIDGSVTCPSGWVAPAPDGQFYGTVRVDSNNNGRVDAADAGYPNGGVQKYNSGTCTSSADGTTSSCLPCSPDPTYVGNCSSPPGIAVSRFTDGAGNYFYDTSGFEIQTIYFRAPTGYASITPNSVVVSTNSSITPTHSRIANFLIRSNNFTVTSNVRTVTDASSCTSSSGNPYSGASLNLQGGTTNLTQSTNASGATIFNATPQIYTLSLQVPSGYSVVGRAYPSGGTASGVNGMSFTLSSNTSATFCIAVTEPWFQTDLGDVRFSSLNVPVPSGKYASTGNPSAQYPGIYYSSDSNANFGSGAVSSKGWLVNNEYSYNTDTQNRNGTVSYSFYKARARTEGATVHPLTPGTLNQNEITESGVFEASGDLVINSYSHVAGRRVVILASGNITINTPITISTGQGLLIVASKQNLTIASSIGQTTLNSTTSSLDGYYSAEGSIILPSGANCPTTPDRRLNIGGALVANSVKPFSTNGTGTLQNQRTLCTDNLNYPTLYISSRLDFLTQLTDFYKVPYAKWREERP